MTSADAILSAPAFNAFPLRGIAIGNGWIDPREQYQGYVDFGYAKGLIREGSKVRTAPLAMLRSAWRLTPFVSRRQRRSRRRCSGVGSTRTSGRTGPICPSI